MSDFAQAFAARARAWGLTDQETAEVGGALASTKALEAVRGHRRGALLLLGPPGTGKTTAALRWLVSPLLQPNNWDHDGSTWLYRYLASSHLARTARSLAYVRQYDSAEVERLVAARALVLDDLGQEYLDKSGFLASLIDHVVSERHRRGLPTVLTANLTFDDFSGKYGDRVADRVGGDRVVVCDGSSLRRGAPEKRSVRGLDEAAAARRVEECERARQAEIAIRPRGTPSVDASSEAFTGGPAAMTPEEVELRKAELVRQLELWRRRQAAG